MAKSSGDDVTQSGLQKALYDVVSNIPSSRLPVSRDPGGKAAELISAAQKKSAVLAAACAIPPGPLGLLTIVPDLVGIWKMQSQLVADIAAVYGKTPALRREAMLLCLFKHGVASIGRDLLVRVGQRVLIRRASLRVIQALLAKVGIRVTQKLIGRGLSRWIPLVGAGVMGAYAWYDTGEVGRSAVELFGSDVDIDDQEATDDE
jgi:hypothetical protein